MKKRNLFNSTRLLLLLCILLPAATFFSSKASASDATPGDAYWQDSSPGQTNGYTMAFAEPKTYDGTPYIEITDIIFADVLTTDDVHATARGTLSGCDAGTYFLVNIDQIVLSGADKDKYEDILPTSIQNVPINFESGAVIEKAQAEWSISCDKPEGAMSGDYTRITVAITNDFGNPNALPDSIIIHSINDGYDTEPGRVFRDTSSNTFSASIWFGLNYGQYLQVWAEVPEDAKNYTSSVSPVLSIPILEPLADYYWSGNNEVYWDIALNGHNYYTAESLQPFLDVWESIDWNLGISKQYIVDQYYALLSEAYHNLVLKPADYVALQEAISKIPEDLSLYTEESVQPLTELLASIDWDLPITSQDTVDSYTSSVKNAVEALKYKPADYSKIQELLSSVPKDLTPYTEESVQALEEVKDTVDWDLTIDKQSIVDGYADKLQAAIEALELKPEFLPADYSKVEEALSKIPSDLSLYTEESVKVLEEVKASIRWDLKVKDQATVDGYVLAIEQAIQGLQKKQIQAPQPQASNPNQPAPVGQVSAKTADSSHLTLWILIFAASACVIRLSFKKRYSY